MHFSGNLLFILLTLALIRSNVYVNALLLIKYLLFLCTQVDRHDHVLHMETRSSDWNKSYLVTLLS